MINFIEGEIDLGDKKILVHSNPEDLASLVKEGLIEKREFSGGSYYYVETLADGMMFAVFISLKNDRIQWIRLSWLDSSMQSWDDVSEKAVKAEYRLLSNFFEKMIGRPPDNKRDRFRTWRLKWGQLNVSYDLRAFQADIYMKP